MERTANRYVQLRPIVANAPSGSYWIKEGNILELPSSGKVNVFKQDTGVTMPLKRWVKFDFVVYLEDTSAEVFMDGKSIYPRTAFDACDGLEGIQPMTGVSMIRVGFTPTKSNNVFPLTTTYVDNFNYEVVNTAPEFAVKDTRAYAAFDDFVLNTKYGSQGIDFGNFDPTKGTYMFNHAPAYGLFGKASTDASLSLSNDTSPYPHDLPLGEKDTGINQWRTHQYISIGDSDVDNLSDGDTVEFSANFALQDFTVSKSADVKTLASGTGKTQYNSPSMVVFDTTGGLSIFGKKVALDKPVSPNKWYQIRVFITPSKNDGATSNTYTAYVNGKKVIENEPFKANDKDTTTPFNGFGYIRFGYSISSAPLPGGETLDNGKPAQYKADGFYIDDIEYSIYRNSTPPNAEVTLTHENPTFNSYIEGDRIVNLGQTSAEFLNGLSGTNVRKLEFIDAAGKPVNGYIKNCYLRITTNQDKELYYSVIDGQGRGILSTEYEFSNDKLTISKVPLRTPVEKFIENITLYPEHTGTVLAADKTVVPAGSFIESGMFLRVTSGDVVKDYVISSEKLIDESFNAWEGVVRANNQTSGDLHGWGFGCPSAETYDSAFIATTQPAGRNSLSLQLHSSNVKTDTVTDSYKHMSISKGGLNSKSLGDKFVMELSFMIDEASAMNYVVSKINDNQAWLNPIEFVPALQGQTINVWNVPVSKYELNQWYRLTVLSDKSTGECIVYLNGEKIYQDKPAKFADFNYFAELRIQHQFEKNTTRNFYVDDFSVYSIYSLSSFDADAIDTAISSTVLTIDGNNINGFEGETAETIQSKIQLPVGATAKVLKNGVSYSGPIETGMVFEVTASDQMTVRQYIFKTPNADIGPITFTVNGEKTNNKFSKGDIIAKADITCYKQSLPATLVIGQYEGNKLVGMNYATKNLSGADSITASFHTETDTGTTIKIMLLDQLSSLKPLQLSQTLEPFSNENIEVDKNYFCLLYRSVAWKASEIALTDTMVRSLSKNGATSNGISTPSLRKIRFPI